MTETKISSFSVEVNLIDLESDNSGNSLLDAYILAPEGLAMEFGVAGGGTINQLAGIKPERKIYGFDAFKWRVGAECGNDVDEWPGRTEASKVAPIRARVAGILQRQLFAEGSDVKAQQPLFQIDPAPYRVALASAQAALAKSQANEVQAKAQADRSKPLAEAQAVDREISGDRPAKAVDTWFMRTVGKVVALRSPMPWDAGAGGRPSCS